MKNDKSIIHISATSVKSISFFIATEVALFLLGAMMNRKTIVDMVNEIAGFWEPSLRSSAMDAVRNPNDIDMMENAQRILLKHDERQAMAVEIIRVISSSLENNLR